MVSKKKRSSPKLRLIFRPISEILTVFQPKNRWSPNKKKKKKVFTEIETDFPTNIGNSNGFSALKQVVSKTKKQKKRSSPKLRLIFRPKSEILTLFQAETRHVLHNFGTQFPLGGLFSIFHQKSASKAPKMCDFAYFTIMYAARAPPPPGYATAREYTPLFLSHY